MRDGPAAGLTCVVTADRAVPGGRLAAVARHRLVLPLADRADYAVAGIPTRDVPAHRPPGRALVGEDGRECQIALPRPPLPPAGTSSASRRPLQIVELPPAPRLRLPPGGPEASSAADGLLLPVGPGGDEGLVQSVDLARSGGLLVTGPPGSGRSAALAAFAEHVRAVGASVLVVGRPPWTTDGSATVAGAVLLDPADETGAAAWRDALDGRPGVVVADDLGAPADAPALARLCGGRVPGAVVLVAAAHAGQLSQHYQGPVATLRRNRTGLLLCPGPGDADLLGVRLPRTPLPQRPGSGWLVTGSALQRVQVARRDPPLTAPSLAGDQSSSSAEPISWLAYQASS
jgi:S-DNA-T family DNA segregation ATPase FtsK/SpoIIIE